LARNITFNGVVYTIPDVGDDSWGLNLTNYFVAIPQGVLQKSGGAFTLSGEVDFGANYGLIVAYLKSRGINPASTGLIRLNLSDIIAWRNNANSADLALAINGSDQLTFNGSILYPNGISALTGDVTATGPGSAVATIGAGKVTNAMLAGSIAYSKLSLSSSILNSDLASAVSVAKGGTGQITQTLGFNALSPATTKGDIIVHDGTNNVRQVIGTDGQVLVGDSTQTNGLKWTTLQQGAKNYITFNNFENNSTTGWSLGNVTLTSGIPTGVPTFGSGASGSMSIATVSSGQLAGVYSLSLASSAATTAGNFLASQAYTIDKEDQAKALSFKFYYSPTVNPTNGNWSGTSSNSFGVAIWDVVNASWIIPAGVFNLVQSSGVGIAQGTFQTPSNMTQFRIVLYNANATTGAITVLLDDFNVGPQSLALGPPVSDWTLFTPTGSWTTNSSYTGKWRRVGDTLDLQVRVTVSGAPNSTSLTFNLPAGLVIDTNKIENTIPNRALPASSSSIVDNGTQIYNGTVTYASTTSISVQAEAAGGPYIAYDVVTPTVPFTFGSTDYVIAACKVPIVGWSSNTLMSNDTDTRVIAMSASYTGSQTLSVTAATPTLLAGYGSVTDTNGAFNSTTGVYTVQVSGWYSASFTGVVNNASVIGTLYIKKNATTVVAEGSSSTQAGAINSTTVTGIQYYNTGDTIGFYANAASGSVVMGVASTFPTTVCVHRLSGPAVVAASESVNLLSNKVSGSQTSNSAWQTVAAWDSKARDSHSGFNATSGVYSVPSSGFYVCSATLSYQTSATGLRGIKFLKNGSDVGLGTIVAAASSGATAVSYSIGFPCVAGDAITVQGYQNSGGNLAYGTSDGGSNITIFRQGN
jgi:hypothetical protein